MRHCKAAHNGFGIVLTSSATRYTLAHEIGHAFGMSDIYVSNDTEKEDVDPLFEILNGEVAAWAKMTGDWNGGCHGRGSAGVRYYRSGTSMKDIIGRMIMLGVVGEVDERRDITDGDVHGVYYVEKNGVKTWHKGMAPVGFPWTHRNRAHQ